MGNSNYPNEELIVSGLIMFIRGCATIASGFIGAAVSSAGEAQAFHKGSYGAGKWLPLILTSNCRNSGRHLQRRCTWVCRKEEPQRDIPGKEWRRIQTCRESIEL